MEGFYYHNIAGETLWQPGFWLVEPTTVQRPNTLRFTVVTGSGSQKTFTTSGSNLSSGGWQGRIKCHPQTGVQASLKLVASGTKWAYLYTTRGGTVYRFEQPAGISTNRNVLTKISDPNGNSLTLHYEAGPETSTSQSKYPRLIAVEDALGRILKFSYGTTIDGTAKPRHISSVAFGLGTAQSLTTTYQQFNFSYAADNSQNPLISTSEVLGAGEPRGSSIDKTYEYAANSFYLNAVVAPMGYRTEFDLSGAAVNGVRIRDAAQNNNPGTVLHHRYYSGANAYNTTAEHSAENKRQEHKYSVSGGNVTRLQSFYKKPGETSQSSFEHHWSYSGKNVTRAYHRDVTGNSHEWYYKLYYEGPDRTHNRQMGNVTKWEQIQPVRPFDTVRRQWGAEYEKTFNRPILQIDPMGHRTTFSYDANGNLTELRHKANTGVQPHRIDHDIITTHQYDSYGNRTKTTFMPGTTQEKVVETVYDATHHTYPIEVKTTVTVNGVKQTIKTKSEWDVNRGLKTADIDAHGKRTEYAYWKDRRLKYTRRVTDNLYSVPTHDKHGNLTQLQVRKDNWQTGTLISQTKTEYDAMDRAVKAHSFKDNWTTPYATTETTYDIFGHVTQSKDPRGLITNFSVDDLGRVTKQTLPDGDWVETRYDSLSLVTKAWTKQNGSETSPAVSYTYDILNRTSQVDYNTGELVVYTYDLNDNILRMTTNDRGQPYIYIYTHDQLNRVKTRVDTLLRYKTFWEYDDASMRTRMYIEPFSGGAKLYDVSYSYDEANRLLSVTDALTAKTATFDYFDIGALKTVTNPNGTSAHRTLDSLNRLDTLEYKLNATTVLSSLDYTYDDKSNVTQLIRNDTGAGGTSKTFSFGYDKISRLTSANYGDETVSYTYDKSGNRLTQVSSVDGTTTYTIAADSNQLTHRSLVPEDSDFSTMSYTYDAEGKLTQRSEGADSDAFTYYFGSQLKQIQQTRNNVVTQTVRYNYNGNGQRVKVADSEGTRYFLYDGMMPVLEFDADKNVSASYLYGADGVVYRRKAVAVAHWHFDEGNGTIAHDVDGLNNGTLGDGNARKAPAWSTENGGSLRFDGSNDLVKVPDSDALDGGDTLAVSCWVKRSSAASGYLVKKIDSSNGYQLWISAAGELKFDVRINGTTHSITSAPSIPLNDWTHVCARYDSTRGKMRLFIDGVRDAAETNASGTIGATSSPLWLGYHDDTAHHFHGHLDELSIYGHWLNGRAITELAANTTGRYEYQHANALGSNIMLTDDTSAATARYEYDVFGAVRSETGTSDNPRKFTGKEYESDVKLYYYGARYYDPYIGRFTQRDPVGDGVNWYAYANNNPLAFIDPNGLEPVQSGVTTVERFADFIGDSKLEHFRRGLPVADTGLGAHIRDKDPRYIHTENYGWLDMNHFMAAAASAADYVTVGYGRTAAYDTTYDLGFLFEVKQFANKGERNSAFSYEDLPSNHAGATFGAYHYDPNGPSLGQQIANFLNDHANPLGIQHQKRDGTWEWVELPEAYHDLPATPNSKRTPPRHYRRSPINPEKLKERW